MFIKRGFPVIVFFVFLAAAVSAQSIDPGTGVRLTQDKSFYPVWSPDGKWIASCGMFNGVWLIPADGGSPVQLAGNPTAGGVSFMTTRKFGFTPDNREILYTSYIIDESRGTQVTVWKPASGSTVVNEIPVVMAVDIQTKVARVVREEAEYGRFSRSGRYFAYVNYDHRHVTDPPNARHHYSLAVYDSVTKETRFLTDGLGTRTRDFSFSGDESFIAAAVEDTTGVSQTHTIRYSLYMIPLDGRKPVDIAWRENPWSLWSFYTPECSPDGRWILYTAMTNIDRMLFAYDTVTGKTTPVFPRTGVWNTDATISPDGKKFCCQLELTSTGKGGLFTFPLNPSDFGVQPTLAEVPLSVPREYGEPLVHFSMDEIGAVDSVTYAAYKYLSGSKNFYNPTWSPDGGSIGFVNMRNRSIWTVPTGGGLPGFVATYDKAYDYKGYKLSVDMPRNISFSPDGKSIVFDGSLIDESRGTVVTITEGPTAGGGYHFGYSIRDAIPALKAVDVKTGETRIVMDSARNGVYSHDGRYLAYSRKSDGFIVLHDPRTGDSRTLTTAIGTAYCFAPDDSYLIARVGSLALQRIPTGGGEARTLFSDMYCSSASLSPDGRLILFQGSNGEKKGLFIFDQTTGGRYDFLVNGNGFTFNSGAFSPNGAKVCYLLDYSGTDNWTRIYIRDFASSDYGIKTAASEKTPWRFTLTGNYPNPFNPSTTISFALDSPGRVGVAVYSLTGQKVRELIREESMIPGGHSVLWDGRDGSGRAVSSGIYIVRIAQGNRVLSGKMMLIR